MTEKDIIKALYCCGKNYCNGCDFKPKRSIKKTINCSAEMMRHAHDLITRQQAEIERYKSEMMANAEVVKALSNELKTAKTKSTKEFAERLKEKYSIADVIVTVDATDIENLVKETVGDKE